MLLETCKFIGLENVSVGWVMSLDGVIHLSGPRWRLTKLDNPYLDVITPIKDKHEDYRVISLYYKNEHDPPTNY